MNKKETRNTKQKDLIYNTLLEYRGEHLSANELYRIIKKKNPGIGIATIYRNLKMFEDMGIVRKLIIPNNPVTCYEIIKNDNKHAHHHLICQKCGEIIDFEEDLLETVEKIIQVTKNFTIADHKVIFYGICAKCSSNH